MTEQESRKTAQAIVAGAVADAARQGVKADRTAATLFEAAVTLMVAEVGPMGAAAVIRQMADRLELGGSEIAGHG